MPSADIDLVSAFVIEELTGDKRRLRLSGRALPYRPLELSGTQRSDVTWYPGSPIGTIQVFGAQEEDTTIRGYWKDRFIQESALPDFGQSPFAQISDEVVETVRALVREVDDMRRKGQLVEVTWLNQARRGIIKRFTSKWHNAHDVEWEMVFQWISQAETVEDHEVILRNDDLSDLPSLLGFDVNALSRGQLSLLEQAGAAIASVTSALNGFVDDIQAQVLALEDVIVSAQATALGPLAAAQRVAGILDFLKRRAKNLEFVLKDNAVAALLNGSSQQTRRSPAAFGTIMKGRRALREQSVSARNISATSAEQQDTITKRLNPAVIRTFTAREGQDLRDISTSAYGTPDEWRTLARFNRFSGSGLEAGQVVFVPLDPPRDGGC